MEIAIANFERERKRVFVELKIGERLNSQK